MANHKSHSNFAVEFANAPHIHADSLFVCQTTTVQSEHRQRHATTTIMMTTLVLASCATVEFYGELTACFYCFFFFLSLFRFMYGRQTISICWLFFCYLFMLKEYYKYWFWSKYQLTAILVTFLCWNYLPFWFSIIFAHSHYLSLCLFLSPTLYHSELSNFHREI